MVSFFMVFRLLVEKKDVFKTMFSRQMLPKIAKMYQKCLASESAFEVLWKDETFLEWFDMVKLLKSTSKEKNVFRSIKVRLYPLEYCLLIFTENFLKFSLLVTDLIF